jgi:tRNA-modifying protein YgfZ
LVMSLADDYRALRRASGIVDRSARGRLVLTGADRRSYLQGLLSNDIEALVAGTGCYTAYLTAQGRMIADMRVFETGDSLLTDLDGALAEPVADRWSRFIFSEDVQIRNDSQSTSQIGVFGPHAAQTLSRVFGDSSTASSEMESTFRALPVNAIRRWDFLEQPAHVLASDDIGIMGFEIVLPANLTSNLLESLRSAGAIEVGAGAAEICRVEGGRPLFLVDMDEDTIPLEAGIEDRAISLTKGCYVGQEVIIRVLHRGHGRVARKLVGIAFEPGAAVPSRGDRILASGRDVGSITSAVESPSLGCPIALGYVHRDFQQPGTPVTVGERAGTVRRLPFVPTGSAHEQVAAD